MDQKIHPGMSPQEISEALRKIRLSGPRQTESEMHAQAARLRAFRQKNDLARAGNKDQPS